MQGNVGNNIGFGAINSEFHLYSEINDKLLGRIDKDTIFPKNCKFVTYSKATFNRVKDYLESNLKKNEVILR